MPSCQVNEQPLPSSRVAHSVAMAIGPTDHDNPEGVMTCPHVFSVLSLHVRRARQNRFTCELERAASAELPWPRDPRRGSV
jgi:hypothetical protein